MRWPAAWLAAGGFAASALALLALVLRPAVEIHESHLKIGRRKIAWSDVRRLDRTGWNAPLVLHLTVAVEQQATQERVRLIYPGDLDACRSLLRHLRRYSREALLDGVPYPQFWGEVSNRKAQTGAPQQRQLPSGKPPAQLPPARYPVLRPEEEEEVERMFQRLKTEGSLDPEGPIGQHGGPHGGPRREQRGPDEK